MKVKERNLIVLFIVLIGAVFQLSGCVQQCNPTYLSNSSSLEKIKDVNGLPIKVNAEDKRPADKKVFMKLGFMTYKENGSQPVQLARSSKEIIQTAFGEGFKRCGFTLNEDSCVVADISIEKFFCTISGGKDNEALIELEFSLKEDDKTIYQKHISETYRQKFNAFRQNEDAEPLLSQCLTMAIEKTLADVEFKNQVAANVQSFQTMADKKELLMANELKVIEENKVNSAVVKLKENTPREITQAELLRTGKVCFPEYDPSEGKLLFKGIQQKYKDCELSPMFVGPFGEKCSIIVSIPINEYYNLSLEEKKKIMNYASSLIPDLKEHPFEYSGIPSTAPIFKIQPNIMEKSTSMMNYNSCGIAIGPIKKGNYYKTGTGEQVYGSYVAEEQIIYPDDL